MKGIEAMFAAVMTKDFPKLMPDTKPQKQEVQRILIRIND